LVLEALALKVMRGYDLRRISSTGGECACLQMDTKITLETYLLERPGTALRPGTR